MSIRGDKNNNTFIHNMKIVHKKCLNNVTKYLKMWLNYRCKGISLSSSAVVKNCCFFFMILSGTVLLAGFLNFPVNGKPAEVCGAIHLPVGIGCCQICGTFERRTKRLTFSPALRAAFRYGYHKKNGTFLGEVSILHKTSKKLRRAAYAGKHSFLFQCPVCASGMEVVQPASLKCSNGHNFDFAKQGYVNLLTRPAKTKYDRQLFEARRKLMAEKGFFEPVTKAVAGIVAAGTGSTLYILDSGCGEGTHLQQICQLLEDKGRKVAGVGIDLAKEAIIAAARTYGGERIWCVADLAQAPFKAETFDVIVNILSPSNYGEFERLLKPGGRLLKVVPKAGYLQELRAFFYSGSEKEMYSNKETIERFQEKFRLTDRKTVQYTKTLDRESLEALTAMTPLAWNAGGEKISAFLEKAPREITVELDILIGNKD